MKNLTLGLRLCSRDKFFDSSGMVCLGLRFDLGLKTVVL